MMRGIYCCGSWDLHPRISPSLWRMRGSGSWYLHLRISLRFCRMVSRAWSGKQTNEAGIFLEFRMFIKLGSNPCLEFLHCTCVSKLKCKHKTLDILLLVGRNAACENVILPICHNLTIDFNPLSVFLPTFLFCNPLLLFLLFILPIKFSS